MWAALLRIQQYPKQIEADLAFRGVDLRWWHRGALDDDGLPRLSSRKLLVLLDELPETSSYKTALRDGNWPVWVRMLQTVANETSLNRAAQYAGGDDAYDPMIWVDPVEARKRVQKAQADKQSHEESQKQMYDSLGWT